MKNLWLDLETYCETPITDGTYAYAERVEILLIAYAVDDGPAKVADVSPEKEQLPPAELKQLLEEAIAGHMVVTAHNSMFDRTVLRARGVDIPVALWRDTMVQALSHSLPGALSTLCDILQVPADQAKEKDGRKLVHLFCKPRPKNSKLRRATRDTHPDEWARFVEYARLDVEAMRAVHKKLPAWNYQGEELALWHLDQTINDRGFMVDTTLANAAVRAVERAQTQLASRIQDTTDGRVQTATQRDAMLKEILEQHGVNLPDLQKSTLERRIDDPELPEPLRELLAIRLQASTTSTAKYQKLVKGANWDGRLRGTLQFNGASRTGRWAGRVFQPQNLPRPTLKQPEIDLGIDALCCDCADLLYDNVMELTSSAIRGCLVAPEGKQLVIADLSNIEGRVLAWLAGEEWKLKAFADFDAGDGADLYNLAYARSFRIAPGDVTAEQRQVGKVQELALGYQGGVGAFVTFAATYGIDLEQLGEQAYPSLPDSAMMDSAKLLDWMKQQNRPTFGLSDRAWIVCDVFKRLWRESHRQVEQLWHLLETFFTKVVNLPEVNHVLNDKLTVRRDGAWLRIRLPSGRSLCYPSPQVDNEDKASYMGMNQYSRKWSRIKTYGGKLAENITQAVSRDVMAYNMSAVEAAGYEIVLSVHDELITEAPDSDEFNAEHLSQLMATNPPWAEGLPLAAAGFETYRYRKE